MSYTSEALAMDHILRDIHKINGLISDVPQGRDHPVFPYRDKRKRPVIWIERAGFQWLRGQKMLAPHLRGYVLADDVTQRLRNGEGAVADPSQTVYIPNVVGAPANTHTRTTPLDRLARRRGQERGKKWLSAAEVEAGHALMRDYACAGEGQIGTQDFTNPGVDGGDRNGAAERAMLRRITAGTRLRAAREKLGPDLAPALIAFCCRQEDLEAVERQERWAAGSGKQIIKLGLARLAELYGTVSGEG
ncbi:MAG: DUF6456 domain-containing protein [Litorimonas sp.]